MKPTKPTQRVAAVDVLRALTMTLMLFVNDFAGIPGIPHWLKHAEMTEDMLGFSDIIFPAFIFCMGMSVVLAIDSRYRKGDTPLQVIAHMFWRTVALVTMGLFSLNSGGVAGISHSWFMVLMVIGFFLIWGVYPRYDDWRRHAVTALKAAGVLLLAFLIIYKDIHGRPFHTGWWGILGLIGWTYAVCAVIYLFARDNYRACLIVWGVLVLLSLGSHSEIIPYDYASRVVLLTFIPSDWTLHAIGFSGIVTILTIRRYKSNPRRLLGLLVSAGVVMLVCGIVAHNYWIVSKIQATPTYLFYNLAMFLPVSGILYWLCDIRGHADWFAFIRPAGTATLTCYLIPYIWYAVMQIAGWSYPAVLNFGYPGLLRSAVFAIVVVAITGVMAKAGIKLKV